MSHSNFKNAPLAGGEGAGGERLLKSLPHIFPQEDIMSLSSVCTQTKSLGPKKEYFIKIQEKLLRVTSYICSSCLRLYNTFVKFNHLVLQYFVTEGCSLPYYAFKCRAQKELKDINVRNTEVLIHANYIKQQISTLFFCQNRGKHTYSWATVESCAVLKFFNTKNLDTKQ